MHVVRYEDLRPQSHAEFLALQRPEVRAAAATAESLSGFLHEDCTAIAAFVRKWLVLPVKAWYRRGKLHEELMGMDDRTLADIGISRAQVQWLVNGAFVAVETSPEQAAEGATLVRLPVEGRKESADPQAEEPRRPMAA